MKAQWTLVIGLLFAIIIAIFAVVNVEQVPVNYILGEASWPLILIILGSAFIGAIISTSFVFFNLLRQKRHSKQLMKELDQQKQECEQLAQELQMKNEQLARQQTLLPSEEHSTIQEEEQL